MPFLFPDIYLNKITDITPELLNNWGIKGLLIDVDNTSAIRKKQEPLEGFTDWLLLMQAHGIKMMILSNANPKRVKPFAKKVGLPFYYFTGKPFPLRILLAVRKLRIKRKKTAIIGDQIFTDVIGGNIAGLKTILVKPIEAESGINYKIKRSLERKIMKRFTDK